MKILKVKIKELKQADYNPRKLSERERNDLIDSIKEFGIVDPIIVNGAPKRKNIIIGGHQRCRVAEEIGMKEIPVYYINIPNIEKEKELNLRLNKNLGHWDWELLTKMEEEMLLKVGFGEDELGDYWDKLLEIEDDEFNLDKALAEIDKPETKLGDIYQLGKHKLMCGDSTNIENVKKLMGKEKADMVYCDPPYNIGLNYKVGAFPTDSRRKSVKKKQYTNKGIKDNLKIEEYKRFLETTIQNAIIVSKNDVHIFYWCDQNYIWLLQQLFQENGITQRRVCIWIKNNYSLTPHIAFNKAFEPCVYGTIGKPHLEPTIRNLHEMINKEIGSGNEIIEDIIDIFNIWLVRRDNAQEYKHPTQKPVTLNEKPIKRCTKFNDIVLDLFGGSGSTLIAAEQLKRRAYLMEIDPIFCDVIKNRWEELTKRKVKRIWPKKKKTK